MPAKRANLASGKSRSLTPLAKRRERVRENKRREKRKVSAGSSSAQGACPRSKAARDSPRPLHVLVSEWVHVAVKRDGAWEKPQVHTQTLRGPPEAGKLRVNLSYTCCHSSNHREFGLAGQNERGAR